MQSKVRQHGQTLTRPHARTHTNPPHARTQTQTMVLECRCCCCCHVSFNIPDVTCLAQGWTIVDVRIEGDYAKGHCEGAINLPLFRFVQVGMSSCTHRDMCA